ncbi:MAG TPA: BON domain-containing protein [Methylomirabilota bacterium]|nr:BON domain-containing protein [Methylomirabilota bacterium]
MKLQIALSVVLLGVAGCTKKEVVTQTESGTETNEVLIPKRGVATMQETNTNPNGHVTGTLTAPGQQTEASGKAAGQQTGNAEDDELARRVRVAISTGSTGTTGLIANTDLTPLQVEAKDGEVTIRGRVESQNEVQSIIKQVQGLQGVKGVKAELEVGPVDEKPAQTTSVQGNANESLPDQHEPNNAQTQQQQAKPRATE